jgi:uncharacterized protein YoxC
MIDPKFITLIVNINKSLVAISKTQESTNSTLTHLVEINKTHCDNSNSLIHSIDEVREIHQRSTEELHKLTARVEDLNKSFEIIKIQMDFKEKLNDQDKKKANKITLKMVWDFVSKYFMWIVLGGIVLAVVLGVLDKGWILQLIKSLRGK